jgi:hypothetical protein
MPNPNYERLIEIEKAVTDAYEIVDPTKYFQAVKISSGEQIIRKKFAQMPTIPKATKESIETIIEKFSSLPGEFRVPRHRLTIEMTEDEYNAIMGGGEYEGFAKNAAKALSLAVTKTMFQNVLPVVGTGEVLYWGLADVGSGSGTFNRPLDADVTTKVTGAWSTALIAANSAAALKGRIIAHQAFNDGTPLVCFYDAVMETVFEGREPSMSVPTDIREIFTKKFGALVPIPTEVINGINASLITGVAPSATSFATLAANPNFFVWLYEQPPTAKLEPKPRSTGATLTIIHNGGIQPIPVLEADGVVYKASQAMLLQGT